MTRELLTPRERFGLLVIDEPQDRVPIYPLVTSRAARVLGRTVRDYCTDGVTMARCQLAAQDRFGHDFISLFSEVGLVAEALGSEYDYPEDDVPMLSRPRWRGLPPESDLSDPRDSGRMKMFLEAAEYAWEARSDTVPVLAFIPAPFTTAQQLVDPEEFLLGLLTAPEAAHRLLDWVTRATVGFTRWVIEAGGLPVVVDPLASGSVISGDQFREFASPYAAKVIRFCHRYDLDIILHVCGDDGPVMNLLPETGADLLSIDVIGLDRAIAAAGSRCRVVGNFPTTQLWLATPAEVGSGAEEMVRQGRACPKGFVAATGCEVPQGTPDENIDAFVAACREAGANRAFGQRRGCSPDQPAADRRHQA